jgi:hypothetical protein
VSSAAPPRASPSHPPLTRRSKKCSSRALALLGKCTCVHVCVSILYVCLCTLVCAFACVFSPSYLLFMRKSRRFMP